MSESHCTNPTGGLLIRLKHKKKKHEIFRMLISALRFFCFTCKLFDWITKFKLLTDRKSFKIRRRYKRIMDG